MLPPRRRTAAFALAVALAGTLYQPPKAAAAGPTIDDALRQIETYASQALQEQGAPGMSVAITDRQHTLRILTFGYANLDAKAPVTAQTRFPIGSITKGMTALGLMELHDQKRFDPRAPVRDYLPWFALSPANDVIYAHQLLSHTAGVPGDYSFSPGYLYSVAALRRTHTTYRPGTSWAYSNDGLATAGAMLAAIDGKPWADSLQARVFDALGMTHSSPVFTPETLDDAAFGYVFDDSNILTPPNPRLVPSFPGDFEDPAGSVISTPGDMAKYMRLILNGGVNDAGTRVLSPASFALWTTPDKLNDGKLAGENAPELQEAPELYRHYAFGLAVHDENGDTIVGHTGGIAGYSACMENDVTRGFGVAAMSNLVEAPLHPCAIVLYAIAVLRAQSAGQPLPPIPPKLGYYLQRTAVPNASRYAGTFTAPDGTALTFTANGDTLALQTQSGPKTLYPRFGSFWVDDARFTVYGLTFLRNKAGTVDEVVSGAQWFANAAYTGPKSFTYPAAWSALLGRYETLGLWGVPTASRVYEFKGRLTMDGTPLEPKPDGSFASGSSAVRFDTPAGSSMQRMRVDDLDMYRIALP